MVGFIVHTLDCTMRETVLSFPSPHCSREFASVSSRPQWPTLCHLLQVKGGHSAVADVSWEEQ